MLLWKMLVFLITILKWWKVQSQLFIEKKSLFLSSEQFSKIDRVAFHPLYKMLSDEQCPYGNLKMFLFEPP